MADINARNDPNRIPYTLGYDSSGTLIYTDQQDAEVEYTYDVRDPNQFDDVFVEALARKIASLIAPSLTAGDPHKMAEKNKIEFLRVIQQAEAVAGNEVQPDDTPDAESIRGR